MITRAKEEENWAPSWGRENATDKNWAWDGPNARFSRWRWSSSLNGSSFYKQQLTSCRSQLPVGLVFPTFPEAALLCPLRNSRTSWPAYSPRRSESQLYGSAELLSQMKSFLNSWGNSTSQVVPPSQRFIYQLWVGLSSKPHRHRWPKPSDV